MELIIILLTIVLLLILKKEEYFNENKKYDKIIYNANNLERYRKDSLSKKMSMRDFNNEETSYYIYPYRCLDYKDIILNY